MSTNQRLPVSKHFRLEQLTEGVFAAIHLAGGSAICNAGIIDLGDRTLVFDSFMSPLAAEDLRQAAEVLTGRRVDSLLNSHWHNDHIWGNQVFEASTQIIASEETRRMLKATKGHGAFDDFMAEAEGNLESALADLETAQDESQRREIGLWVDYHQCVVDLKPVLEIRLPTMTFKERMRFHGPARAAEMIPFAGGHTESDAILWLPEDGIMFMSDLLFIEHQPYLGGGDPESVLRALDAAAALKPEILVPGHGPVGGPDSLGEMAAYIQTLDGLARKMVEKGEAEGTIDSMPVPAPYDTWLFAAFFPVNMHYLYQRHSGA